jgi:HSP20 family protein
MKGALVAAESTSRRPFADLEDVHGPTDRLFAEMEKGERHKWSLPVDVIERDDKYLLRADAPGFKPDQVKIEIEDDVLTVSAEHEESEEENKDHYLRRERRYGSASRSITLPKGVRPDQVEATCKDGIVEVSVPKPKEDRKATTTTSKTT